VFQLVNIFMYGFFVLGDANRYLDCLGIVCSEYSQPTPQQNPYNKGFLLKNI